MMPFRQFFAASLSSTPLPAHPSVMRPVALMASLLGLNGLSSFPVQASTMLEEVVVTAQMRAQDSQDVPIAISAFNESSIKALGAESISDLGRYTPGVEMNNDNVIQPVYNIRGIGTTDFTVGSDPAVAVYIDGVYNSRGASAELSFNDIDRIEILKGPQGTLFGRNATGGAIHVITKKPEFENEQVVSTTLGDYGRTDLELSSTGPLTENLAYRFGAVSKHQDGYLQNLSGPDLNDIDSQSFRASLLWTPSEQLEVIWRTEYSEISQNSGTVFTATAAAHNAGSGSDSFDLFGDVSIDYDNLEEREMFGSSIEVSYQFQNMTVTSITGFRNTNALFNNDEDGSADPLHHFHSVNLDDQDQLSQEFRLTGEHNKLKWTLGGSYNLEHVDHTTDVEFNYTTFETFALYDAAFRNPSLIGLAADSSPAEVAEFINTARAANPVDGIVLSQLMFSIYQNDLANVWAPAGCGGNLLSALGVYAGDVFNAALNCVYPQIAPRLNTDLWQETVHNTGRYQSSALYGDFTYALTDKMNLSAGLRYTYDHKEFSIESGYNAENYSLLDATTLEPIPLGIGYYNDGIDLMYQAIEQTEDWDAVSGRIVLDYAVNNNAMVYGSIATGFKSGGFNSLSYGSRIQPSFPEEEVTNYEVGIKSDWSEHGLRFNSAVFFYEYENKQDLEFITLPGSLIPSYNIVTNDSEGYGIEMEVIWAINERWLVGGNYSHLQTEITAAGPNSLPDIVGKPQADTPEHKVNLMGQYTMPIKGLGNLSFRLDYNWTDDRINSSQDTEIPDYFRANARISFTDIENKWSASFWVDNLTDEKTLGDYAGPASSIGSQPVFRYPPRMMGIDLTMRFH